MAIHFTSITKPMLPAACVCNWVHTRNLKLLASFPRFCPTLQ